MIRKISLKRGKEGEVEREKIKLGAKECGCF